MRRSGIAVAWWLVVFAPWLHVSAVRAQETSSTFASLDYRALALSAAGVPTTGIAEKATPGADARRIRRDIAVAGGTAAAFAIYGLNNWWKEGFTGRFRTVNEGWFGADTYAGGMDKLGHLYTAYAGGRLLKHAFMWAGNDEDRAIKLGALTMLGVLEGVEIVDGFSKHFRFSKEDFIVNILGAGMGVYFERHPTVDRVLDFRLQYWPSAEARQTHNIDPVSDFSGQTWLLVAKAGGVPALRERRWLRYLELAVGYGVDGYDTPGIDPADRHRHFYVGISLNLSAILHATVFNNPKEAQPGRAERVTDTFLEFVQVPGTAALADHEL